MADTEKVNRIERRKLEFRDKITNAAIKLFEEQGVEETSVASIIVEADIAHKTFFNHFPSKAHLLQHIVTSYSSKAYQDFREGFEEVTDPKKRLHYCFSVIAKTLATVKPQYKKLLNFYLFSGAGSGELQNREKELFTELIKKIYEDASALGALKEDISVETYTEVAVGLCLATLLNWSLEDDFDIIVKMENIVVFLNSNLKNN